MKRVLFFVVLAALSIAVQSQNPSDSLLRIYDRYWEVMPGTYRVMKNGLVGVVGTKGIIVPLEYQQVWNLASDKNYFRVMKNGKTGLYHTEKGIIVPAEYDQIWDFSDGMAKAIKDGKLGLFGTSGEVIVPCNYQQIWDFSNGRAKVIRNGKIGYVNASGQEVVPCLYQQIGPFVNGIARVIRDGNIGFIDMDGHEVIPCEYQQIWDFNDGIAKVVKNGRIGYIDQQGKEVIPPVYSQIWDFEGDSAKAVLNGNLVYIHKNKAWVTTSTPIAETPDAPQTINISEIEHHTTETHADSTRSIKIGKKIIIVRDEQGEKSFEMIDNQQGTIKQEIKKPTRKNFKGHYSGLDIGYNNFLVEGTNNGLPPSYRFLDLNSPKSVAVHLNLWQEDFNITRNGNLGMLTGLGIDFNNYRFDSQYQLTKNEDGLIWYNTLTEEVKKNKLSSIYLSIPLMMELQIPTNQNKKPLYLSAGVVGGLRLKSYTKIVYANGDKDKTRGNYNLQDLRMGLTARVGYKFINLHTTYYVTPLFKNANDIQLTPYTIGFSFMPDWM